MQPLAKLFFSMIALVVFSLLLLLALVRWSRRGVGYGGRNDKNQTELKQPSDLESAIMGGRLDRRNRRHYLFKPEKYNMTMGLRKLDENDWLTMDEEYLREHRLRAELLAGSRNRVLRCLPGSEAACVETLEFVVEFLTKKWPDVFELFGDDGAYFVRNNRTGEAFQIVAPYEMAPLEIVARLAMEDFNVLVKDEVDDEYCL
jgi:Protein of unknown function (DUF3445)